MKRFSMVFAVMLCLTVAAFAVQSKTPPAGKKQFVFKGKVEKVDASNKTLSVKSEKVDGWMDSMTMNYALDKEDALKKVKPGDEITVEAYRAKDGSNTANAARITFADGRKVFAGSSGTPAGTPDR